MSVALISVLRCVVSMTVNASVEAGDIADKVGLLAHLSRRLVGELIVYPWSGVRPSSSSVVVVHNFKHEYLCRQLADGNQILSKASLGWGKGCIRFWTRLDQNSGFHGNRKLP